MEYEIAQLTRTSEKSRNIYCEKQNLVFHVTPMLIKYLVLFQLFVCSIPVAVTSNQAYPNCEIYFSSTKTPNITVQPPPSCRWYSRLPPVSQDSNYPQRTVYPGLVICGYVFNCPCLWIVVIDLDEQ